MVSTPSHTPLTENPGLRSDNSTDVITKLREKHRLTAQIQEMEITLCQKANGLHLDYPSTGEQVRRATAIKIRVNGPK